MGRTIPILKVDVFTDRPSAQVRLRRSGIGD